MKHRIDYTKVSPGVRGRASPGVALAARAAPRRTAKMAAMQVTNANGKICYLEIPAVDVERSAIFYASVFGWKMRRRGDGATAFDDSVEVSGAFVTGRPPSRDAGLLTYVMVADIETTIELIAAHGGEIVEPPVLGAPETIAHFRDPAGNLLGLYQEKALSNRG